MQGPVAPGIGSLVFRLGWSYYRVGLGQKRLQVRHLRRRTSIALLPSFWALSWGGLEGGSGGPFLGALFGARFPGRKWGLGVGGLLEPINMGYPVLLKNLLPLF